LRSNPNEDNCPKTCPLVVRIAEVDKRRSGPKKLFSDHLKKGIGREVNGGLARNQVGHGTCAACSRVKKRREPHEVATSQKENAASYGQHPAQVRLVFKSQVAQVQRFRFAGNPGGRNRGRFESSDSEILGRGLVGGRQLGFESASPFTRRRSKRILAS